MKTDVLKPLLILFLFIFSNTTFWAQTDDLTNCVIEEIGTAAKIADCTPNGSDYMGKYRLQQTYIPNISENVKTVKIRLHFIQKDDGSENWQDIPSHHTRIDQIIAWLNGFYGTVPLADNVMEPYLPPYTHLEDSKIRFELVGTHFYQNTSLFGVYSHSVLNNFLQTNYPDRTDALPIYVNGAIHPLGATGSSAFPNLGDGSMRGVWTSVHKYWTSGDYFIAQHLAHELGHSLMLRHTYNSEFCVFSHIDFLWDVFPDPNDFPYPMPPALPGCDIAYFTDCSSSDIDVSGQYCTNNLMSGLGLISYNISPLQIGRMHRATHLYSVRQFIWGYSDMPHEIVANETWDFSIKMYEDIVVKSGNTLTIRCEVQMVPEAKIIVEQGARLVVDGGKITTPKFATQMWQGIQVYGDLSTPQVGSSANQGRLILKNGAVIENAIEGVQNWKQGDWSTTGGIIKSYNSSFVNCKRAVQFLAYDHPSVDLYGEQSRFVDTKFIWDDNLMINKPFPHMTMYKIDGLLISGCDFMDERTEINESNASKGIFSINASYRVLGRYISLSSSPEDEYYDDVGYDVCNFKNLLSGVEAMNCGSQYTIKVDHSRFGNCKNGINIGVMDNAIITRNLFEHDTAAWSSFATHISVNQSVGFHIEGNVLKSSVIPDPVTGVHIENSGEVDNKVYKNFFEGLKYGNYAKYLNRSSGSGANGLRFVCNEYNNSGFADQYAFGIEEGHGMAQDQGTFENPAGNKFTNPATGGLLHFGTPLIFVENMDYSYDTSFLGTLTAYTGATISAIPSPNMNDCVSSYQGQTIGEGIAQDEITPHISGTYLSEDSLIEIRKFAPKNKEEYVKKIDELKKVLSNEQNETRANEIRNFVMLKERVFEELDTNMYIQGVDDDFGSWLRNFTANNITRAGIEARNLLCYFKGEACFQPLTQIASRNREMLSKRGEMSKFVFYPNPTRDQLTLVVPEETKARYEIRSINGKIIAKGEFVKSIKLDCKTYPVGIYVITVRSEKTLWVEKMIVK